MTIWRDSKMLIAVAAAAVAACAPGADARPARDSVVDLAEAPVNAIRFTVAASGNVARYRVREQLMGRDLPNDAVGETGGVSGAIIVDSAGRLIPGQSRFVVRTTALKSDSDRRDGYVRRRLLEAEQYPTVELVPTALRGLPARLSPSAPTGPVTFDLIGDLTVRGVTRPTTWRVTVRQSGEKLTGTASTRFTFAEFRITPPRVPIVLSVADTIGLEYDFTLTRDGPDGE
jgi:polyisoprenoid-binding protein YceI